MTCQSANRFGEVVAGHLDLAAPLQQGWLVPLQSHDEMYNFWGDDWRQLIAVGTPADLEPILGRVYLDQYDNVAVLPVVADRAAQARPGTCMRITAACGMLVERVEDGAPGVVDAEYDTYRRVGIVEFERERGDAWWENGRWTAVRLI